MSKNKGYSQQLGKDEFNPNETEITKEYSNDFHLNTIKTTIDYLHNSRNQHNSEKHDELIHDLTKLVTLVKGFELDYFKEKTEPTPIEELIEKHTGMKYEDYLEEKSKNINHG